MIIDTIKHGKYYFQIAIEICSDKSILLTIHKEKNEANFDDNEEGFPIYNEDGDRIRFTLSAQKDGKIDTKWLNYDHLTLPVNRIQISLYHFMDKLGPFI